MESAPTRYPHKDASTTSWDRCRSHDQGISASLGQSQGISKHALRRTSYRADTKHLHRTKSVTGTKFAGDRVFGRHEPSRHRGGGSSCSTASTASSTGVSKPWVQGGTYGTGKSFGLSGVDHEAARRKRGEGGPQKLVSRHPAVAIPGYGGFAPGVYAGNAHGETVSRTNRAGLKNVAKYREGKVPKFSPPPRWAKEYGTYNLGTEIPGYGAHFPGKESGNLVGMCTARASKSNWRPER